LNRVDDHEGRLDLVDVTEHGTEVGLGREKERVDEGAGSFGAKTHLTDGFFGADVENGVSARRNSTGDIQKKRRFADTRFA
jgi:hypothetical protein